MLALLVTVPSGAQDNTHTDWAKAKLAQSPRHMEYVTVQHDGRSIKTFVVYPEVKDKAPVVILIHEIFGVSDWMKLQTDELAAKGYIVLTPDLLTASGGTDGLYSAGGQDKVVQAVMGLDAATVNADLDAVADYGKKLPAANGKLAVARVLLGWREELRFRDASPGFRGGFRVLRACAERGRDGNDQSAGVRVLCGERCTDLGKHPAGGCGYEDCRQGV